MSDQGVCVITHPLGQAGENATRTLLNILAEIGPVFLITANLPADSSIRNERDFKELTPKGVGDGVLTAAIRFFSNQIRMSWEIRKRPEETVLFFGATSYLLPIIFARIIGKHVLVEPRGDVPLTLQLNWEQQMPRPIAKLLATPVWLLERIGFAISDRVVTYTPNMARELGLKPTSEDVFPHGARYVDTDTFRPIVPYENRDNTVGFVGRLDEEKGIRQLVTVAKMLPEEIKIRFVGDGPLYDYVTSELHQEIEEGKVELTGWVDHDEIHHELNKMKLLILPSKPTEGLPTTILESMACGTPAYSTPVAGVPDVVHNGKTGFLMQQTNPVAIAERIEQAIGNEGIEEMSGRCRSLVEDQYSKDAAVRRYLELFESVEANG